MGLETESQMHAGQGKDSASSPASKYKPSHFSQLVSNVGHVDNRTLIYVLLIIVACALVIVAISAMSQTFLAQPSTASSFARHH